MSQNPIKKHMEEQLKLMQSQNIITDDLVVLVARDSEGNYFLKGVQEINAAENWMDDALRNNQEKESQIMVCLNLATLSIKRQVDEELLDALLQIVHVMAKKSKLDMSLTHVEFQGEIKGVITLENLMDLIAGRFSLTTNPEALQAVIDIDSDISSLQNDTVH